LFHNVRLSKEAWTWLDFVANGSLIAVVWVFSMVKFFGKLALLVFLSLWLDFVEKNQAQ